MTPEEQQAYRAKYLRILENDALTVIRNLALLEVMDTERRKLGVEGKHPAADLYNLLALNAQSAAMIALSRLFDEGSDAISTRRIMKSSEFNHPDDLRELKKGIPNDLLNALKGWRNNLLVHSLQDQISSHIPDEYPITPHQLADALEPGISVIHAYSRKNGFGSVSRLPDKFLPDAQYLMSGVDKMIGGLFA